MNVFPPVPPIPVCNLYPALFAFTKNPLLQIGLPKILLKTYFSVCPSFAALCHMTNCPSYYLPNRRKVPSLSGATPSGPELSFAPQQSLSLLLCGQKSLQSSSYIAPGWLRKATDAFPIAFSPASASQVALGLGWGDQNGLSPGNLEEHFYLPST